MNQLTFWGLLIGVFAVAVYLITAFCRKKTPDLAAAVNILISTVGAAGAVRLVGFAFTEQFLRATKEVSNGTWWSLTPEDAIFLVVGGLALLWISCLGIRQGFKDLG